MNSGHVAAGCPHFGATPGRVRLTCGVWTGDLSRMPRDGTQLTHAGGTDAFVDNLQEASTSQVVGRFFRSAESPLIRLKSGALQPLGPAC